MASRARIASAAAIMAMLLSAPAALAQSDADRATARVLAQEGKEALDKKDYATAEDRFGRADALVHAPTLLLGLARAQAALGKLVAAQESYKRILREGAPKGSPDSWFRAVEDAKVEVEAISPKLGSITVKVKGPTALTVTIDGVPVPAAAVGVRRPIDPGEHKVEAAGEGFAARSTTITINEAGTHEVELVLQPLASAPASARPDAGTPPKPAPQADSGGSQRTFAFVALGIGGAGLVLGGVTWGIALSKHGALADQCPDGTCPAAQHDDLSSYRTMTTISTIGFIAGGVGVAAGVVLLLTAPSAPAEARVGAFVGPRGAGITGSF